MSLILYWTHKALHTLRLLTSTIFSNITSLISLINFFSVHRIHETEDNKLPEKNIKTVNLGIWTICIREEFFDCWSPVAKITNAIPTVLRIWYDMLQISPFLFTFCMLAKFWSGLQTAMLMHLSNQLLIIMEAGIASGNPDKMSMFWSVVVRLCCIAAVTTLDIVRGRFHERLRMHVVNHFGTRLMHAKLNLDLSTPQDASMKLSSFTGISIWNSVEEIIWYLNSIMQSLTQLAVLIYTSNALGDPIFAVVCVARPIFITMIGQALWGKPFVAYPNNGAFLRKKAMEDLSGRDFLPHIQGIKPFILHEYQGAMHHMGPEGDVDLFTEFSRHTPFMIIGTEITNDLPTLYSAYNAVMHPSKFSLASIAIMRQSSFSFDMLLVGIFDQLSSFFRSVDLVKQMYSTLDALTPRDGEARYFPKDGAGMNIELQNVSLTYPGSASPALKDVSLSIESGELVILVGGNGSGKSTLVKVISRLLTNYTGDFKIDGHSCRAYCKQDLEECTAILCQNSRIFPLSLAENIGLGLPMQCDNIELITEAAKRGGAYDMLSQRGFCTVLNKLSDVWAMNIEIEDESDPLSQIYQGLRQNSELSGGERQRLLSARLFMRLFSENINFVGVDEPSSELDAICERELFDKLIEHKGKRTMVIVAHHFHGLAERASKIVCMKDGQVAETGTHVDLMKLNGVYAELYNAQGPTLQLTV